MSMPEAMVARKNFMRWHEEEILRGIRLKREAILFWVTLKSWVINHSGKLVQNPVQNWRLHPKILNKCLLIENFTISMFLHTF